MKSNVNIYLNDSILFNKNELSLNNFVLLQKNKHENISITYQTKFAYQY